MPHRVGHEFFENIQATIKSVAKNYDDFIEYIVVLEKNIEDNEKKKIHIIKIIVC